MPNPWISPPSLQSGGVERRGEEGLKGVPGILGTTQWVACMSLGGGRNIGAAE